MKNVQEMSGCSVDQKVKYTAGSFVVKALTWWNFRICTLSREGAVSMSWNDFKFMMIEEFFPGHEMQKLETKLWNHAMSGLVMLPILIGFMNWRGHLAKDCKGMPRNVNPVNAKNPTVKACYECGSSDHVRSACPRLNSTQGLGGNCPNQVVANNGAFYDYHNMVAILEKSEYNVDFHPIVDFVEASHLMYALTFKPTVCVSHIRQFWSTARIKTTKEGTKILATIDALPPVTTAPIPTVTPSDTPHLRQYTRRARIAQSSALPPIADEPASPLRDELTDLCTSLQRQQSDLVSKFEAQELEITMLKARVKLLEDREGGELTDLCTSLQRQQSDLVSKFEAQELEITMLKARVKLLEDREGGVEERSRDDAPIKGMRVIEVPTGSGFIPTTGPPATGVPTGSDVEKKKMIESETLKKKKIQEQMDIQMARQLEGEMGREAQRINEQIARDAEIEYHQFATELPIERRIELISDLREFYTSVLRNQAGWKVKDFKGMTLEEIKENFDPVWKQIHDFIPIGSKEEAERFKRKGIKFEQKSVKKLKTSEEVNATEEVLEEKVKEMIQLIPVEEVYVEALQVKHLIVDLKVHIEGQRSYWKITRWEAAQPVELKRLYEPDDEDQLWTHTHNIMHAPVEWKLYDSCGVHYVTFKDKEIFMLVEKDYPLRKGLVIVMISYKLQVENYSQMESDLILKIYKIANRPRQEDD
nr:reverse transcriptase domain-containing protein [Tanacetum cinerariifolium]